MQDKIIFENPGYVRAGKIQMRLDGVPNIFNVWADEGWVEPVIEERFDPDRTVLSLEFKKKTDDKKPTIKTDDK